MNRWIGGLLIVALYVAGERSSLPASAQSTTPQPAPTADVWGEAVDGVQLHLSEAGNHQKTPGDLPQLELQVRNLGNETVTFASEYVNRATQYEIDGVWWGGGPGGGNLSRPPEKVPPGAQSIVVPLAFRVPSFQLDATTRALIGSSVLVGLTAGKHNVRARTFLDPVRFKQMLVRNAITVEIPGSNANGQYVPVQPAAATGQALIPDSWGDSVDGIQLGIAVTAAGELPYERPGASPKPLPVDLPHLEFQLWNRGQDTFPITSSDRDLAEFEVDGIWYGVGPGGGNGGRLETLAPGGQSHIYALMFRNGPYELDAKMARVRSSNGDFRVLDLKPGKHSVRVRAGLNVAGKQVLLISNTITIEISNTPATRQ